MLRTQIFLPEDYYHQLRSLSQRKKVSVGHIIRIFIKSGLENKNNPFAGGNNLTSLAKLKIKGGPKDLSKDFDNYLYNR